MLTMLRPSMKARNSVCVIPCPEREGAQTRVKAWPPPGTVCGIAMAWRSAGMRGGGLEACWKNTRAWERIF